MSSFRPQWSFFWWDSFRFKLQQLDSNKMHAIRSEPKMPLRRLSTSDAEEASLPLHTPKSSHSQSCVLIVYRMKSWTRVAWFLKCIFPSRVTPPQAKPSGQGIFSSDWYISGGLAWHVMPSRNLGPLKMPAYDPSRPPLICDISLPPGLFR